ncbi:hypothetical protein SAMN05421789_11059 [Kaistella chaponensis]|uniref:Uncharacterized protein n=1 Tax=Kaistella chaponensis TaxID=713588 RepID=A0A1N7MUV9_9FLAO|nr:hypothetical protein [Kaistella chaponensis]SIS89842.1 hypothetical protein SAMN05421789_11059 [Kaistella chaponensis]
MSLKIRKIFNIKENLQEFTQYIGCDPKGIYYIENNTFSNKHVRYFLFLRKKGYNINDIMDRIIEEECRNSIKNPDLEA